MPDKTMIFASSIARRWIQLVSDQPAGVLILSPYLTPGVANRVIESAPPAITDIYTLFSSEVFATGSSSLQVLKRLISRGYRLHRADDLHAKVVLTDRAATIGSQNLTGRGARNFEVSALVVGRSRAASLKRKILRRLSEAQPITMDHIAALEPLLPKLRKDHAQLAKQLAEADAQAQSDLLKIRRNRERDSYNKIRERSSDIRRAIGRMRLASERVRVRLASLGYGDGWNSYRTLKASSQSSLLRWRGPNGEMLTLDKTVRYLMIQAETGRLAWPAIFESQISKISRDLEIKNRSLLRGYETVLNFELIWDPESLQTRNVRVSMTCSELGLRRILSGYFSVTSFSIFESSDESNPKWRENLAIASSTDRRRILSLMDSEKRIANVIRRFLLEPFKFERNGRSSGLGAFLAGTRSSEYWIHVRQEGDKKFLILSTSPSL